MTKCLCLASLVFAVGCVDEPNQDPDQATGEAEQALTGTALQNFPCDSPYGECTFPLGPTPNRACVLAGFRGMATGTDFYQTPVSVYVENDGTGGYDLEVEDFGDVPVTVTTLCVSSVTSVQTYGWSSGQPLVPLTGPFSSEHCFLSGWSDDNQDAISYADSVKVYQDGAGVWWLGGSKTGMTGEATCFNGPADEGAWSWGQTSGVNKGNLQYNGAGGVACALTELGGVFRTNSDGVWIGFDPTYNVWTWTFSGATHAAAECFK